MEVGEERKFKSIFMKPEPLFSESFYWNASRGTLSANHKVTRRLPGTPHLVLDSVLKRTPLTSDPDTDKPQAQVDVNSLSLTC